MNVLSQLASALERNDERPNLELAERLARSGDQLAIKALVESLAGKSRPIRSDAIKVLYEVGERAPGLIAPYLQAFVDLLGHKDNRLVWGAMSAIDALAAVRPEAVHRHLARVDDVAHTGSVITRDRAVKAMTKLAHHPRFAGSVLPRLLRHVEVCPVNQLPMYAELAATAVSGGGAARLRLVIRGRLPGVHQLPKRRRLEKIVRALESRA